MCYFPLSCDRGLVPDEKAKYGLSLPRFQSIVVVSASLFSFVLFVSSCFHCLVMEAWFPTRKPRILSVGLRFWIFAGLLLNENANVCPFPRHLPEAPLCVCLFRIRSILVFVVLPSLGIKVQIHTGRTRRQLISTNRYESWHGQPSSIRKRLSQFNAGHLYRRDVPGVEALMREHQSLKVEIDARQDSFQDVIKMGEALLAKNHYATVEVRILPTAKSHSRLEFSSFFLSLAKILQPVNSAYPRVLVL